MQKIHKLGSCVFENQDPENVRVNSFLSLAANTRLGSPIPTARRK
jgi:hypothetical protein